MGPSGRLPAAHAPGDCGTSWLASVDEQDRAGRNERRLKALQEYDILDTPRERDFDDIATLAAEICATPIAVVNLISDVRQFFKAETGLGVREAPFNGAFCVQAILEGDFLIVPDASKDPRFADSPLVAGPPHLRFYAGARLTTPAGVPIGTVCVLDYVPRSLTDVQQRALQGLARQAMAQLELRRLARLENLARRTAENGERRYRAVFDSAVDYAIVVLDRDGIIKDWNEGAVRILGWSRDEAVGQDVSLFFTEEDREHAIHKREMASAHSVGRGMDERWHLRRSGELFWANGEMMPLKEDDGTLIGYVKILRDQTAQRLAEDRLKASEKRWRELFEQMAEGFFVGELIRDGEGKAVDYRFIEINPAFATQSGIPASAVGTTMRAYAQDLPQQLIDRCAVTVETGEPQSFEIYIAQLGRWFDVRSARESEERFLCLFFDITQRREIEEKLRLSEERLKLALSASGNIAIWDWALQSERIHGDANFARMYGLDLREAEEGVSIERYLRHVVPEDLPHVRLKLADVFEGGTEFLCDYRLAVPGEALRWVECKGAVVGDAATRSMRFSGTTIDITARKMAEQERELLSAELAHRVKNTFSVVQAIVAQTLRRAEPALSETLQNRLAALSKAHGVLLQSNWETSTLESLMTGVLSMQAEMARFDLEGPDVTVGAKTALSLSLLLHELSTNALKYGALSVDGGKVVIRWSLEGDQFRLVWREEGGPAAVKPERRGFGSRLIEMGINGARNTELDYGAGGLTAMFTAPREAVAG